MAYCPECGMPAHHEMPCGKPLSPVAADNRVLQRRYELVGVLGQGGMGTVYMARDLRLHNRPCVVKKLRDDFYRQEDRQKALSFFEREAGVLSRLKHPNIVHVLDFFQEGFDYFLVMEYVEGKDLGSIVADRGSPFPEEQVLPWVGEILDVLEYLHGHDPPVIYRDLKPSNVMIDVDGRVKLVDFGIARPFTEGGDNTHVISPGYSPPEQYWGAADQRSDIYALGATMYFLLTGVEPLALHQVSPANEGAQVTDAVDEIVRQATSQSPQNRYQTVRAMTEAVTAAGNPDSATGALARPRTVYLVVIAVVAALAAGALLLFLRFEELVQVSTEKLKQSQEALSRKVEEQMELNEKLRRYGRAIDADTDTIKDWQNEAVSGGESDDSPGVPDAHMPAQMSDELDLTDETAPGAAYRRRLNR